MESSRYLCDALGRTIPDGSWPPGREAPGALEGVRRLCNTENPESGADLLRTADDLAAWLEGETGRPCSTPTLRELERVRRLRSAVRDLVIANRDPDRRGAASASFDAAVAHAVVTISLRPEPRLMASGSDVDVLVARIAEAVYAAHLDGTWARLKACCNDHCRWTVYDHSKNGSSIWCSRRACGSRIKARAWRARARAAEIPG